MRRKKELEPVVKRMMECIEEFPDGTEITTYHLVKHAGFDAEKLYDDMFDIHFNLFSEAEKANITLDMSKHDGLVEGLPFNLDYVIRKH